MKKLFLKKHNIIDDINFITTNFFSKLLFFIITIFLSLLFKEISIKVLPTIILISSMMIIIILGFLNQYSNHIVKQAKVNLLSFELFTYFCLLCLVTTIVYLI